ncbi:single-stranded DNA-binding protein [Nocardia sp. alder85J]|uniref:single-stranded DNA-binding protein n=1 Tax=Nocardia sp. alder85J TaxID=2862949 RepID=UPI001CD333E9|nr:single-stranded DNA-binding protein [Nocardia sp. alder85J]MCX4099112.1 single-stranded DNA-binding protein [Nocardia sp. alder85J]
MSAVTVEITGHLADNPAELRITPTGKTVTSFVVIANDRRRDDAGEWVDAHTTSIRVTVWGALAEHVADTLTKGTLVTVTGDRLTPDLWIDREGQPRATLELRASRVGIELATQTAKITRPARAE